MLRFPIFRESPDKPEEWVNVSPRSVASVLETERPVKPPWPGPVRVAVLTMWDKSVFVVPDPDRKVAGLIEDARQPAPRLPEIVTKRKPMV